LEGSVGVGVGELGAGKEPTGTKQMGALRFRQGTKIDWAAEDEGRGGCHSGKGDAGGNSEERRKRGGGGIGGGVEPDGEVGRESCFAEVVAAASDGGDEF